MSSQRVVAMTVRLQLEVLAVVSGRVAGRFERRFSAAVGRSVAAE